MSTLTEATGKPTACPLSRRGPRQQPARERGPCMQTSSDLPQPCHCPGNAAKEEDGKEGMIRAITVSLREDIK